MATRITSPRDGRLDVLGDRVLRVHDGGVAVPRLPVLPATQGHVGVDLLSHYLPRSAARPLAIIVGLIGLAVCIYLTYAGAELTLHAYARGERTESAWAPLKWPLFLAMPVGLGLTALQYVADLLRETLLEADRR